MVNPLHYSLPVELDNVKYGFVGESATEYDVISLSIAPPEQKLEANNASPKSVVPVLVIKL